MAAGGAGLGEPSTQPKHAQGIRPAPLLPFKMVVEPPDPAGGARQDVGSSVAGKIVVVVFLDSDRAEVNPLCKEIRGISPGFAPKGVMFVGVVRGTNEEGFKNLKSENYISWPLLFDPKNGTDGIFRQWKVTSTPWATIVDPKGLIVAEDVPAAELSDRLLKQLELTPPRMFDDKLVGEANYEIEVAKRLLATGNWQGAIRALSRVPGELYKSEGVMDNFTPISRDLEGAIPTIFAQTEKLHDQKQSNQAILLLQQLKGAMKGSIQEQKIDDQLNSFLDDPDLKADWEKSKPNIEAADLVASGGDLETLQDFVAAHGLYARVIKEFAKSPAAADARAKMAAIEKDPALLRKVRDAEFGEKARAMLNTADAYRASKLEDKARSFYEQIIKDYDGTTAAEAAKQRLANGR